MERGYKRGDIIVWTGELSEETNRRTNGCCLFKLREDPIRGENVLLEMPGELQGPSLRIVDDTGVINPKIRMATESEVAMWDLYALSREVL